MCFKCHSHSTWPYGLVGYLFMYRFVEIKCSFGGSRNAGWCHWNERGRSENGRDQGKGQALVINGGWLMPNGRGVRVNAVTVSGGWLLFKSCALPSLQSPQASVCLLLMKHVCSSSSIPCLYFTFFFYFYLFAFRDINRIHNLINSSKSISKNMFVVGLII